MLYKYLNTVNILYDFQGLCVVLELEKAEKRSSRYSGKEEWRDKEACGGKGRATNHVL